MLQAAAQHLGGHAAGLELLQARKAAWQEAFLSLKAAVRSSACDCFYVLSPAVSMLAGQPVSTIYVCLMCHHAPALD